MMTAKAERHLKAAKDYIAKGDEFYRKAKPEIESAIAAGASQVEVARFLARSRKWVQDVIAWDGADTLYAQDTERRKIDMAKQVLKEVPAEQVERIIATLPKDRQEVVGAAAGNEYLKARLKYREDEERLTPVEKKEREAAKEEIIEPVKKATANFLTLGIAGHLDQATEELSELIADSSLSKEAMEAIDTAFEKFVTEYQVARAMVGLDEWEGVEA